MSRIVKSRCHGHPRPFSPAITAITFVALGTSLPDTFRFEANTTAAFYTALLVAVYYAAQGLRAGEDGRPVGKRAAGARSR